MGADGGKYKIRGGRIPVSRLTFTIVAANVIGLAILLFGSVALTQYRDGLIEAKYEGVQAQAQIISDILAEVAIDEEICSPADQFASRENVDGVAECGLTLVTTDVSIVFSKIWKGFEGRVRIYGVPQQLGDAVISDAQSLLIEDQVLRQDEIEADVLPTIEQLDSNNRFSMPDLRHTFISWLSSDYHRDAAKRSLEDELNEALSASADDDKPKATSVRLNENDELVVSVSIPIRRVQAIYGIVTVETGGIDILVEQARLAILPFFGLAMAAAILSSLLLTATIAQPIRQLAIAADKVREGISAAGRARIPDLTNRRDEIGELSGSLKSMTQAIYKRIDAIESFAADVSHELKNPLTSIRSAAETLRIAKTPEQQEKLMAVIQKDVERMDRLITDISNASRLDAELARESRDVVDLTQLISDIVSVYSQTASDKRARVVFDEPLQSIYVLGNGAALGQVIRNLVDNAISFSPADDYVRVNLATPDPREMRIRITVEDRGPGIPPENLESIFERFYTKRPKGVSFGNNSGLGLAISRQIIESHGGQIFAQNRLANPSDPNSERFGARFIVELPVE